MTLAFTEVLAVADKTKSVVVETPEWGGSVTLVTMQSAKYDELEARLTFAKDDPSLLRNLRADYVGACWADSDRKPTPLSETHCELLGKKSPVVVGRLFDAAQKLHAETEEAEKN